MFKIENEVEVDGASYMGLIVSPGAYVDCIRIKQNDGDLVIVDRRNVKALIAALEQVYKVLPNG